MADEWLEMALDLGLITAHEINNSGLHCVRWIGGEVTTLEWAMYCHRLSELREIHLAKNTGENHEPDTSDRTRRDAGKLLQPATPGD